MPLSPHDHALVQLLQKVDQENLLVPAAKALTPEEVAQQIYLAGVIPVTQEADGTLLYYLIKPVARKLNLPPPQFQIAKGTRMIQRGEGWQDLKPKDMPLLHAAKREAAEGVEVCAFRELHDEAGVPLGNIEAIYNAGVHSFVSSSNEAATKDMALFVARIKDPQDMGRPDPGEKIEATGWFALKDAEGLVKDDHLLILQQIETAYKGGIANE